MRWATQVATLDSASAAVFQVEFPYRVPLTVLSCQMDLRGLPGGLDLFPSGATA
jgi:hypothetical protein